MPVLLDFEKFCEPLKEIRSSKIINKGKFHPEGLFSEQIFGPVKNYTCQCGIYHGKSKEGSKCNICDVEIVHSNERRKRFAKLILPIPIINPIFYNLLVMMCGTYVKNILDTLMKNDNSILIKEDDRYKTICSDEIPRNTQYWERLEAINVFIKDIADTYSLKIIQDNFDKIITNKIIVLPPDLRPMSKGVDNTRISDQINRYYMQLLISKEKMEETIISVERNKQLYYKYWRKVQKDSDELYDHILEKMSKKEGLIRGNILGKRIDFSGRAVITPEPTLSFGEVALPYLMILEIYKVQIAKKLIEIGKFKLLNKSIDFIDECIESESPILFRICEEITKNEVCMLNRQPSLHRLSLLGFKIKVTLDSVIKIHPLITNPFGADFDGDQMAVYIPISEKAKSEVRDKIFATKNLYSPSNESLTMVPSQDIIIGLYSLSSDKFPELREKVLYKGQEISLALKEINECFPEDFRLVKGIIKKKEIIEILNEIKNLYDEETTAKVLDNIKRIGFKYSTLFGTTMSLEDCILTRHDEIRNSLYESTNIVEQLQKSSDESLVDILRDNFKYSYMIDSGARGSWTQIKQLVLTRGFISNFNGKILQTPIKNSLIKGLTEIEFFNSTYGCRKGLLDVALNTGISGYLSRKLIFTCANLQLHNKLDDCGTTDYLEVFVKDRKKARSLLGRFYKDNDKLKVITKDTINDIVNKTIYIRSPIFCKSEKICHKCYGELHKKLHTRFIGIIAAQTLGERATQLVLRTFHLSGSAITKNIDQESENIKQDDIIADLSTASNILHKFKEKNIIQIVNKLYDVYTNDTDIFHIHFECVLSQLIWSNNKKWRLLEDRDKYEKEFFSVQSVPSKESFYLGLAFSNPKKHILKGLLFQGNYKGVFDKILLGKGIE